MCPLYPLHLVLLYLCLLLPLLFAVVEGTEELFNGWKLKFTPGSVDKLQEYNASEVQFECVDCTAPQGYPHHLTLALAKETTLKRKSLLVRTLLQKLRPIMVLFLYLLI